LTKTLSAQNHDRDSAGMTYVYPVVSRRAGGVSVGINLNVNNACNWRCIYCQVPELRRGGPPAVDLHLLHDELYRLLGEIVDGDFMSAQVPEGMRRLNDIALSGNGEPTSAAEFGAVVDLIARALADFGLLGAVKPLLISNGSLIHKAHVQAGLRSLATAGGEVWFKLDRATQAGMHLINDSKLRAGQVLTNLKTAASLCPTWIQTCLFSLDGLPPDEAEVEAYLALLAGLRAEHVPIRGVLLYGLARPPMQPEAARLGRLPEAWLAQLGQRIESLGIDCKVFP
jgi:wyosine [tRNA(Phe)-imidazoG37] synthetase (radical SAM superfamily)